MDLMTLMVQAADHLKCWCICIRSQSTTSQKTATFSVSYRGWERRKAGRRRSSSISKKKIFVLIDVAILMDVNVMQMKQSRILCTRVQRYNKCGTCNI
jgi:uncharacterized protein (DUF2384 family)